MEVEIYKEKCHQLIDSISDIEFLIIIYTIMNRHNKRD